MRRLELLHLRLGRRSLRWRYRRRSRLGQGSGSSLRWRYAGWLYNSLCSYTRLCVGWLYRSLSWRHAGWLRRYGWRYAGWLYRSLRRRHAGRQCSRSSRRSLCRLRGRVGWLYRYCGRRSLCRLRGCAGWLHGNPCRLYRRTGRLRWSLRRLRLCGRAGWLRRCAGRLRLLRRAGWLRWWLLLLRRSGRVSTG